MAKFRFSQEKQVVTWVRDYFYVEAETLDEAIAIIQDADEPLERLELQDKRVEFDERDMDTAIEWFCNDANQEAERFYINCCETDDEILSR